MTKSQKSIVYFSYYVLLSGLLLLFFPKQIFGLLIGEIAQEHVFIYHIVGLIACCVGFYYWHCGRTNQVEFFKASTIGRSVFFVGAIIIVLLVNAPYILMGLGFFDVLGAGWTYWALKKDGLLMNDE